MSKIEEVRKATYQEMLDKLKSEPHIVAIPRPTGFGKTYMVTDLIREKKYKNILYVYPAEIIKDTVLYRYYSEGEETEKTYQALGQINGVTLMTYKRLSMLEPDDLLLLGYDLIIFDECHRLGAVLTLPKAKLLREFNPNVHIIGVTATPNRSDGYDVIEEFFEGKTVSPYTLHDAFKDGLYNPPVYCYLHGDEANLESRILEDAFMAGEDIEDLNVTKVVKKKVVELASIYSIQDQIKQTCEENLNTEYMKFICFFSNHEQLILKSNRVISWFKAAFPGYRIRKEEVTSRDVTTADTKKLDGLSYRKKTIDFILCVDMLNMGYHVSDISGIVMYRATGSDIIYPQQYGRVLASGSQEDHVVFDIVDNLHRKLKIQAKQKPVVKIPPELIGVTETTGIELTTGGVDGIDGGVDNTGGGIETTGVDGIDGGIETTGGVDNTGGDVDKIGDVDNSGDDPWYNHTSDLLVMDLKLATCTATYREQIAKLVAEPMQIRCKEAFEAHFKRWCIANGYKYPVTNKELKALYATDKQAFVTYFENLIKENKLDYPMRDAEKLLEIGKTKPDGLPMEVFAKWKNVSIQSILELLEVA